MSEMEPKVLQNNDECGHFWLDYEPAPCPVCAQIKAAREGVLELACVAQCDECRRGIKLVSDYEGYDGWWVHLNEKGGFSDDCSAGEIRNAYKERFGL